MGKATKSGRPTAEKAALLPALVFFWRERDGASRRMQSLIAWVKVTQKKRLRVVEVDADSSPLLLRRLDVSVVPAIVLIKDREVVGKLEGRATGRQIDDLIRPYLSF
jgi:thioredoxin-like negative regulator of GroEL